MSQDETHGIPQTSLNNSLKIPKHWEREGNERFIPFCPSKINPKISLEIAPFLTPIVDRPPNPSSHLFLKKHI
jgi:hypothetical protein